MKKIITIVIIVLAFTSCQKGIEHPPTFKPQFIRLSQGTDTSETKRVTL